MILLYQNEINDEESDFGDLNHPYKKYKRDAEIKVLSSGDNIVLRLTNTYGKGMSSSSVIDEIRKQLKNSEISVRNASATTDIIYFDDVLEGIEKSATSDLSGVFNLCTGETVSIKTIIETMCSISDSQAAINSQNYINQTKVVIKNDKLKSQLSWRPKFDLRTGLSAYLDAYS